MGFHTIGDDLVPARLVRNILIQKTTAGADGFFRRFTRRLVAVGDGDSSTLFDKSHRGCESDTRGTTRYERCFAVNPTGSTVHVRPRRNREGESLRWKLMGIDERWSIEICTSMLQW